jgi:hypothetical protein
MRKKERKKSVTRRGQFLLRVQSWRAISCLHSDHSACLVTNTNTKNCSSIIEREKKFSSSKRITNAKDRKHEEKTQKSKQSEFQTDSSERVSELQKCGVAWLVLFPIDPIKIFNHLDLIFQDFSPLVLIYR